MKKNTLNLLLWESGLEQCEYYINTLKNLGYAVRDHRLKNQDELQQSLDEKSWDLFIANQNCIDIPALELQQQLNQREQAPDTIFLQVESDQGTLHELYEAGAALALPEAYTTLYEVMLPRLVDCHLSTLRLEQAQQKIEEGEQRNRTLMDSSRDAIAYIQDGMHAYTNLSYLEMFDIKEQDELDSTPLLDLISKEYRDEIKDILRKFSRKEITQITLDCTALKGNEELQVTISFTEALLDGDPSIQLVIQKQSMDEELALQLAELSSKDLVTDLNNRRHFIEQLKELIEQGTADNPHVVIMIRFDNYPELQQRLGIAGCDILLRDITDIIRPILQNSTSLARFADDIFTSLHPVADGIQVYDYCHRICNEIANSELIIDGKPILTTVSIGIAPLDKRQRSAEKVLVDVERACNSAQQEGGNRIQELHSLNEGSDGGEISSEEVIRNALQHNRFRLVFQPIVSLHASPGERYQVLLRLLNEKGEEIAPNNFLPAAEEAGLMPLIDRWVIVHSINTLIKQRQTGKQLQLFIKLSRESILEPETIKWISKYLQESRIPGDNLVFELNQEDVLAHQDEAEAFIKLIKQLHCQTAIGHVLGLLESIDYLTHLEVQYLKIDGSLISNLANDKGAQEITKKIAGLSQSNDKQTIAEFVHDANTLAVLWQHGINFVQGYYLQQPNQEMSYNFEG